MGPGIVAPDISEVGISYFWNSRPGANVGLLCQAVTPMQHDWAAYKFAPVLEWLDAQRPFG